MTYKIGDKIKLLTSFYEDEDVSQSVLNGSILEVVDTCRTAGQWIDQTSVELDFLYPPYNHDNEFELAEEEKVKNKFAVGDRVITVKNTPFVEEGFIGFVTKIFEYGECTISVRSEKNEDSIWCFNEDELELLSAGQTTVPVEETVIDTAGPIKSDGGSSSYYDLPVPEWLLSELFDREIATNGKPYIKTEEIIAAFFGNDFDLGNVVKCLVRVKGLQDKTGGKAGNSVDYECNKMKYSVEKIRGKR